MYWTVAGEISGLFSDDERGEEEYRTSEIKAKARQPAVEGAAANPFRYDSSSSEEEAEGGGTAEPPGVAGGGWTQTRKFFFQPDDQRLRGRRERRKVVLPLACF